MQDLVKNKLFLVVAAFVLLNVFVFFGSKVIIDRAAAKVIEQLQKNYSPSPYGPGVDPDKLNPQPTASSQVLAEPRTYLELRQLSGGQEEVQFAPTLKDMAQSTISWRDDWEAERGFSSGQ